MMPTTVAPIDPDEFQRVLDQYLAREIGRREIRLRYGRRFKKKITRRAYRLRARSRRRRVPAKPFRIKRKVAYHQEGAHCPWPPDPMRQLGDPPSVYAPCCWCGDLLDFERMTIEHIVAIRAGGTSDYANLAIACCRCNQQRGHRDWGQPKLGSLLRAEVAR